MSEHSQHDPDAGRAGGTHTRKLSCDEWEAMLVDFLDGTLAVGDPESFHAHRQSCSACAEMFTQAGQGREWLNFLRLEPDAPSTLVARILAQTSGSEARRGTNGDLVPAAAAGIPAAPVPPFWKRGGLGFASRQVAQPRLLMTAAMAFFSITLTLNMAGIRLSTIRVTDLKPSALGSNVSKQFHVASARVELYFYNLRFVYEMEAQVREMRRNVDLENAAPAGKPGQNSPAATPQDGGHKNGGKSEAPANPVTPEQHSSSLWGERVDAALRDPSGVSQATPAPIPMHQRIEPKSFESSIETTDGSAAVKEERGIA
jgi:hypothetical protein